MRLLVVGLYHPSKGFTRLITSLLAHFGGHCEVHFVGLCHGRTGAEAHEISPVAPGVNFHPCEAGPRLDAAGAEVTRLAQGLRPAAALLVYEMPVAGQYIAALKAAGVRPVTYLSLEGRIRRPRIVEPLSGVERCVLYTDFARAEVARAFDRLAEGGRAASSPAMAVIPHGVDRAAFYPLAGLATANLTPEARRRAKQAAFPDAPELHDSFIVLNANRPYRRKRLDITIDGFARFARAKPPSVRLYLHHPVAFAAEREGLLALAEKYGVAERLIVNPVDSGEGAVSDEQLNRIYNACEVGINTAMGEGWGLVSFEHAATAAAQIVPRHTAPAEVWDGAAEFLEAFPHRRAFLSPVELKAVSADEVALKLERLYGDEDHLRSMSLAAYERVTQPRYSWSQIAREWLNLFEEVAAS